MKPAPFPLSQWDLPPLTAFLPGFQPRCSAPTTQCREGEEKWQRIQPYRGKNELWLSLKSDYARNFMPY